MASIQRSLNRRFGQLNNLHLDEPKKFTKNYFIYENMSKSTEFYSIDLFKSSGYKNKINDFEKSDKYCILNCATIWVN